MMPRTSILVLVFILVVLLATAPVASQDGTGVIVEGNPQEALGLSSLNPIRCNNTGCRRITELLFPTLYAADPITGYAVDAVEGSFGLALSAAAPEITTHTVRLRDDLTWSDGTPVTAYDVFYSYLGITSEAVGSPLKSRYGTTILAAMPIDEYTIEFLYDEATCAVPNSTNFPIVPHHVFDPDFPAVVQAFEAEGDLATRFEAWGEYYPDERMYALFNRAFDTAPSVTLGLFDFNALRPYEDVRLTANDSQLAYVYSDLPEGLNALRYFLEGESSILMNPPIQNRDDLLATPDLQIYQSTSLVWDYISFNLADPRRPRDAFDADGQTLDQGVHPIFGDARVRRAIQMAIDVDELIEVALLGYGTPMASAYLPTGRAFDPDLAPVGYDLAGAQRLLEEAGWKDVQRDGIRECVSCLYAPQGQMLSFTLTVSDSSRRSLVASIIAKQLRRVGIEMYINPLDSTSSINDAQQQRYDALLGGWLEYFPLDGDQRSLFSQESDTLGSGYNFGSYYNPEVERLLDEAAYLPGCDRDTRNQLYHEVQAILQADQPYIWLYTPNDMIVAQGGVLGFQPYPHRPFWNIRDWVIVK